MSTTEQVWVCDLTYICVGNDFNYLSLITDAHSRMIVGYCLHPFLNTEGCMTALEMAIGARTKIQAFNTICLQPALLLSIDHLLKIVFSMSLQGASVTEHKKGPHPGG